MYYRDLLSGKYYRLGSDCVVRAFRHDQCVELREHAPVGKGRRWLAHADGRVVATRGPGQDFDLADISACDAETEAELFRQLDSDRHALQRAAQAGVMALDEATLSAYPSEEATARPWRESPPEGAWGRSELLDLLRVLQELNEIAIQKRLASAQAQIENSQEAGYDLWALLYPVKLRA